jgi:hypothetical protein
MASQTLKVKRERGRCEIPGSRFKEENKIQLIYRFIAYVNSSPESPPHSTNLENPPVTDRLIPLPLIDLVGLSD